MLFSKTFCQERIANWRGKGMSTTPASMDVADFCASETEFLASKTVWVNRDTWPRGNLISEFLQVLQQRVTLHSTAFFFDD